MRRIALAVAVALLAHFAPAGATDWSPWRRAYDPATGTRFIPVELWTGARWDGTYAITLAPASLRFGSRGDKTITGPIDWQRPGTTESIKVYERANRGKRQLFAVRSDGTGLGRVLDSRYRNYDCVEEVKFPLGYWRQGEVGDYEVRCRVGRERRPLRVTIEQIDFVYEGIPHSLRFHWLLDEGRGRATDMRYIYSPLRGLVHVDGNE